MQRAIGSEELLAAYRTGYFPMAEGRSGPVRWLSPDPRAVIPLDGFRISRSLRQTLRKGKFSIRIDTSFEEVMRHCASRDDTWISEEIIRSYVGLHSAGYAHSVETWRGPSLAGGLYGVALGGAFFGESMFSLERDASKVALVALVGRLAERGFTLLDVQFMTGHLARFGAAELPRRKYLGMLERALSAPCAFGD